jgi:endonuclease-8
VPEGDSIFRLAARLRPKLVGGRVDAFDAHDIADSVAATVVGHTVIAVESRGKNLLVRFDDGRSLHVHLRMLGRVRFERPRSAYWRPRRMPHQLRLVVGGAVVVGDRIPVLRLLKAGAEERAPDLRGLGPDLVTQDWDEDECVARLRALGQRPIGEALLIQRVLSGIGNIYKSETLFLERVDPLAPVAVLPEITLRALAKRASVLLKANLSEGPRVTRNALTGPRFWVYGRRGRPCFRCGTAIEMIRQGAPPGRSTYHCPKCQAP